MWMIPDRSRHIARSSRDPLIRLIGSMMAEYIAITTAVSVYVCALAQTRVKVEKSFQYQLRARETGHDTSYRPHSALKARQVPGAKAARPDRMIESCATTSWPARRDDGGGRAWMLFPVIT
jgi:hypothetical protein